MAIAGRAALDATDVGEPSGTGLRFEGKALHGLAGEATVHQLGFADLMVALQLLCEPPCETMVFGVQPVRRRSRALAMLGENPIRQQDEVKGMNQVPGRIIEVSSEGNSRIGLVEFEGKRRTIYLSLVPQAQTGDYVRFHAGFATELVGSNEAAPGDEQRAGNGKNEERKSSLEASHAYKLLSGLDPQQLRTLIPLAEDRQFAAGQIIFPSGARSLYLHLIVSGDVALEAVSGDHTAEVQILHAGDAMGWSAFIGESLTHFQARALTPVPTVAFPGDQLRAACDSDPALGYALIERLMELATERLDAMRMKLAEKSNTAANR